MALICEKCKYYSKKFDYCIAIEYNVTGCTSAWKCGECERFEEGEPCEEVLMRDEWTTEYLNDDEYPFTKPKGE